MMCGGKSSTLSSLKPQPQPLTLSPEEVEALEEELRKERDHSAALQAG